MQSIFFPLYPRRAISVVLSIANLILVRTCLTTSQYLSFLFLAMRSAYLLTNCLHSLDIPPDVRNTAGVKVAFSTFNTLSRYSSFFSFSFFSYTSLRVFVLFDKHGMWNPNVKKGLIKWSPNSSTRYVKPSWVTCYTLYVKKWTTNVRHHYQKFLITSSLPPWWSRCVFDYLNIDISYYIILVAVDNFHYLCIVLSQFISSADLFATLDLIYWNTLFDTFSLKIQCQLKVRYYPLEHSREC